MVDAHRGWVMGTAVAVALSSVPMYRMVKQEFTPTDTDEGEFDVSLTAQEGTSLPAMDEVVQLAENAVRGVPHVRTILSTSGSGGGFSSINQGRALRDADAPRGTDVCAGSGC
jgi:HAE1 family hydrophobic/amphiphilic exporter-1